MAAERARLSGRLESLARSLARALTEEMVGKGSLRSSEWRAVFARTHRHIFVPIVYLHHEEGWRTLDGTNARQAQQWLEAVYRDVTLITALDESAHGCMPIPPRSSSTEPSTMALMLEELDVQDGSRVLEIGTGTGYNAALLSERLGSEQVTTLDVEPDLVEFARRRLGAAGYLPTVIAADGWDGYPPGAPYDRIITTCSVSTIPEPWLGQLRNGGVIVADVRGHMAGGLVRLQRGGDGAAQGIFLAHPGNFMALHGPGIRENRSALYGQVLESSGERRTTALSGGVLDDRDFLFLAQLHLPGVTTFKLSDGRAGMSCLAHTENGSWARVSESKKGDSMVEQGGPQYLWERLERAWERWEELGRPSRERFTLSLDPPERLAIA